MRRLSGLAMRLTLALAALSSMGSTSSTKRIPVLLELFTSEGCSSCPPADRLLASLDEEQPEARAALIVLSEHVDYFNNLGWKDPFSAKLFTDRQESLSATLHDDGVYTPQLVVDGRFGFVGSDRAAASAAIRKAIEEQKIPLSISTISRAEGKITGRIESPGDRRAKTTRGTLFVALAEEQVESRVSQGENSGHVLQHVAVTRVLKSAGTIDLRGPSVTEFAIPLLPQWGVSFEEERDEVETEFGQCVGRPSRVRPQNPRLVRGQLRKPRRIKGLHLCRDSGLTSFSWLVGCSTGVVLAPERPTEEGE
jgi:hypothetical protein